MTWILVTWFISGTAIDGPFSEAECKAKLEATDLSTYAQAARAHQQLMPGTGPVAAWCVNGRMIVEGDTR